MSAEPFLWELANLTRAYLEHLDQLAQQIDSNQYNPRDLVVALSQASRLDLAQLIRVAEDEAMELWPHTTWAKVRFRANELSDRLTELLDQLSPEERQRRLLEEIAILLRAYSGKVNSISKRLNEMTPEEFEEYGQEDELSDLETFTLRDSLELVFPLLGDSDQKSALRHDLLAADAIMRRRGAEMFGPLLRMGSLQQLREARFEPKDQWWWYLDELKRE